MAIRKKRILRKKRIVKKRFSKPKVSLSVKKYVKRTIHAQIENKCIQVNPGPLGFGNVLESPDFNAYPMAPLSLYWTVSQGVGQAARIGNSIKVRKTYLNYVLIPLPYNVTTNPAPQPCEVRMMLGYVKNSPTFAPVSGDINQLFQSGNSAIAPAGTLKDIVSVYNKDYWVIKKSWIHKVGYADYGGTGVQVAQQSFANNDFKLNTVKRLDITQYMPKTCIFNDSAATTNTRNLFFMHYAVASTGGLFGATTLPCSIEYWIDFHYEDA